MSTTYLSAIWFGIFAVICFLLCAQGWDNDFVNNCWTVEMKVEDEGWRLNTCSRCKVQDTTTNEINCTFFDYPYGYILLPNDNIRIGPDYICPLSYHIYFKAYILTRTNVKPNTTETEEFQHQLLPPRCLRRGGCGCPRRSIRTTTRKPTKLDYMALLSLKESPSSTRPTTTTVKPTTSSPDLSADGGTPYGFSFHISFEPSAFYSAFLGALAFSILFFLAYLTVKFYRRCTPRNRKTLSIPI